MHAFYDDRWDTLSRTREDPNGDAAKPCSIRLPDPARRHDRSTRQPWRRARAGPKRADQIPSIEEKTKGLKKIDGFFPLHLDEAGGRLWLEIPRLDVEVLYSTGLATGLGSNDIGLDRGILTGSRIVKFERAGPKILMVQPNYQFRALTTNPAEAKTVRDAFARSVLWGFPIGAAIGRPRARRLHRVPGQRRQRHGGTPASRFLSLRRHAQLDLSADDARVPEEHRDGSGADLRAAARSAAAGGGRGGGGGAGAFFEGVGSVAANAEAASIRIHHSIVELPDNNYTPRRFDPRSGFGSLEFENYAALPGQPMTERFLRRHRLQKKDPSAAVSDPVKPITYYLDPGAPEPIRSALLDGARWWNQAFEAAGYRDAFRVELLPDGVSPLDIRYNVINWVHRSTRGWSTGASVTDPRTGEIIKGVVTLGSLRIRQDYMIAEGLLSPYKDGTENPKELTEWGAGPHPPALRARGGPHAGHRPQLLRQRSGTHLGDGLPPSARDDAGGWHARLLEGLRRRHRRVGQSRDHLRLR